MKRCLLSILLLSMSALAFPSPVKWYDGKNAVSYQFKTPMESVVRSAALLFEQDMQDVTGRKAQQLQGAQIELFQLDVATDSQRRELKKHGVDVQLLSTSIDAFQLKVSSTNKIVIAGSNGRGVAYGLLELSRIAGVTPWVWWGDVVPERKSVLTIDSKTNIRHKASVEFRGVFINDEDWSLRPWSSENFDPAQQGMISAKTYRKLFELLLRLRANTIWPGMHPGTKAFFKTPGAKAQADSCGIFIGTSHCEPLLCNNVDEWDVKKRGAFNYITNKQAVHDYWVERLEEVKTSKTNMFTIGMRGIHDGSMEGVKTMDEKFHALQEVIDDQQRLIAQHIGEPSKQPQVFVPYKEVLELYEKGLKVPDYVTLMWCDDNYGYMTRLSNAKEQKRSGGGGVYYHLSYWGRPHDYLWLTTTQPGLIYSEMKAAYDHNVRKVWIANVHDPKIAGYDLELFLDMAWDIESVKADKIGTHLKQWISSQFGSDVAEKIYPAMRDFFRLTCVRKPEHMGWNQVELDKKIYERGISPVKNSEFSQTAFGNELECYLADYQMIEKIVLEAAREIRPELQDAYFARVIYPISAASANAHKLLEAQKARQASARSLQAYERIKELTKQYGDMAGGKWKGLIDMQPRKLPVYMAPSLPVSYSTEEINAMSEIADTMTVQSAKVTNDFICRQASDYTTAGKGATVIDMLGHSMSAVKLPAGEALSYSFTCDEESDAILRTALIPTQPNDNGDLRYAVSIDGDEETVFSLKEKYRSERWKENVLRQQTVREQTIHLTSGPHTLTIRAIDDHIIVDQWMIDFNLKREKFYLFPVNVKNP